ncbi:GNAT family N-acetyltransferase [Qipengyuania oceanensis]|uniref:GNAT family N-acetyltransferase n=1 Tax=Qipengyuania oceanensis TaxID=1463597 RepID=A0A844YG63_9SPHN|nr:GNAT family N-acetyltransferase [Qipengyuania oceanensis]
MIDYPPRDRPVVVTERLELWVPDETDVDAMIAILSHPETHRFLGPMSSYADQMSRVLRNLGSWLLKGYGIFAVRHRESGTVIGNCGMFHGWRDIGADFDGKPEAGWIFAADEVGKGYATEAMRGALEWFERVHGSSGIVCMIDIRNAPSIALARKLGFGELRTATLPDGDSVLLMERQPGIST